MNAAGSRETNAVLLPFYVVVDVSWSMTQTKDENQNTPLDLANKIIPEVVDALREEPTAADKARIGLIDFSGEANVILPLSDARDITGAEMPKMTHRETGTSYSSAFLTLRQTIEADAAQLNADNFEVHRPAAFFLTDGDPTEDESRWREAFAILTDRNFELHPNFIPYGFGEASQRILDQLADYKTGKDSSKPRSFVSQDHSASKAITGMIDMLVSSVIGFGAGGPGAGVTDEFFVDPAGEEGDEEDDD